MVRQSKPVQAGVQRPEGDVDLSVVQLDVYDGRDGWWNPQHDVVVLPEGWEFLPTGQAFVTRTVKADGVFWVAWAPRSRTRHHRQLLGLWAPGATIASAHQAAEATRVARESRRAAGARSRARQESRYQGELAEAIVSYLAFSADHDALALSIAASASERAAVVGSGRVGRTRVLTLQESVRRWQPEPRSGTRTPTITSTWPNSTRSRTTTTSTARSRPKPTMRSMCSSTSTVNNCPSQPRPSPAEAAGTLR
jgi:hypothetical protein